MDEDLLAINESTRKEKIKNFFINNKKILINIFLTTTLLTISYFAYNEYQERNKNKIANQYNLSSINFASGNTSNVEKEMIAIIEAKDKKPNWL